MWLVNRWWWLDDSRIVVRHRRAAGGGVSIRQAISLVLLTVGAGPWTCAAACWLLAGQFIGLRISVGGGGSFGEVVDSERLLTHASGGGGDSEGAGVLLTSFALGFFAREEVDGEKRVEGISGVIAEGDVFGGGCVEGVTTGGRVAAFVEVKDTTFALGVRSRVRVGMSGVDVAAFPGADGALVVLGFEEAGKLGGDVVWGAEVKAGHFLDHGGVEREGDRLARGKVIFWRAVEAFVHPRMVEDLVHGGTIGGGGSQHASDQAATFWSGMLVYMSVYIRIW